MNDTLWMKDASCVGLDPNLFYPDLDTGEWLGLDVVKPVCAACPVKSDCLDRAMRSPSREEGFWGGTTTGQRRHIKELMETRDFTMQAAVLAAEYAAC